MGQEIVYCGECQTQLRSAHFESGTAFRLEERVFCKSCADKVLRTLPPGKTEALARLIAGPSGPSSGRIAPVQHPSTGTRRAVAPPGRPKAALIAGLAVVAVLILVAVLALAGGTAPAPPPPPREEPSSAKPPVPGPRPDQDLAAAQALAAARRLETCRGSLRKARDFAKANLADPLAQVPLFERAAGDARETPLLDEANRDLEAARARASQFLAAQLAAIDERVRAAVGSEEFKKALAALEEVRASHASDEWTRSIEQRTRDLQEETRGAFASLKEKALAADGRGSTDEVRQARERLARWGLADLVRDLDQALADAGGRRPAPEAEALRRAWDSAAALAGARDDAAATGELERAIEAIKEGPLRAEARADLESLRRVATFRREVLQALAKSPRGSVFHLTFLNESGQPQGLDEPVLRVNGYEVELGKEKAVLVSFGEITAASLAEISQKLPSANAAAENRDRALLCLLEGDVAAARKIAGEEGAGIPAKYWAWAERPRPAPPREGEARSLFHAGLRESYDPSRTLDSIQKCKSLLRDYAETAFVRRNRAAIAGRSEGVREYFFLPGDLSASGAFVASHWNRVESCWTCEKDLDAVQARDTHVDFSFSALPDQEYRCWVYAGACCAETFTFFSQATDSSGPNPKNPKETVPMAPGSEYSQLVKHGLLSLKKTHALHTGPKEPSRWEWIQVPLPRFPSPGVKAVRLLSGQKGFSVAHVLVSSIRQVPPRSEELKELAEARARSPRGAAPDADFKDLFNRKDLAGWRVTKGKCVVQDGVTVFGDPEGKGPSAAMTEQTFSDYELTGQLATERRGYLEVHINSSGHTFGFHLDGNNAWRALRVTARGSQVEATLEGVKLEAIKNGELPASSGYIAFFVNADLILRVKDFRMRKLR